MKKPIAIGLLLLGLNLSACSNFVLPTATAVPTATLTATSTLTAARVPTRTPFLPTATSDVISRLAPEGQPASEWKGIPIMPAAIAGEGDEESYVFTIRATPQQIQEYYQLALGTLGWQPFAQGDGNASVMLIFMNNVSETLTVSILTMGDEALVLLVKQGS